MKITWDNIDKFVWSDRANGFRYKNRTWSLQDSCIACNEPFMIESICIQRGKGKYCSRICQVNGKNNPNYNNRGRNNPLYNPDAYYKNNIPTYDTYQPQLEPYGIECRRSLDDNNVLEVKCHYEECDKWHIPKYSDATNKVQAIKGNVLGEYNLYCSELCKYSCSTYRQVLYPKGFKFYDREVSRQLRRIVLERDSHTCQRCGNTKRLCCHHITGVEANPIESADVDNCITFCYNCHIESHQQDGCRYHELKNCDG